MEKNIKVLGKEKMFCSICEEEHDVEFIEEEREIYIGNCETISKN